MRRRVTEATYIDPLGRWHRWICNYKYDVLCSPRKTPSAKHDDCGWQPFIPSETYTKYYQARIARRK